MEKANASFQFQITDAKNFLLLLLKAIKQEKLLATLTKWYTLCHQARTVQHAIHLAHTVRRFKCTPKQGSVRTYCPNEFTVKFRLLYF